MCKTNTTKSYDFMVDVISVFTSYFQSLNTVDGQYFATNDSKGSLCRKVCKDCM